LYFLTCMQFGWLSAELCAELHMVCLKKERGLVS